MKNYLPKNLETSSKEDLRELSYKLYEKLCKIAEHLTSEKLLVSYYEKDETFARARSGEACGPTEYCWSRTQDRIKEFSSKIQNLKDQLNKIADVYDSKFEPKTMRQWEKV